MPKRRKPGHGTIEVLPSGGFRPRVRLPDGQRHSLDVCDTYEEAEGLIAAALEIAAEHKVEPTARATLRGLGPRFLDDLELSGYVAIGGARGNWRVHIETASFADWPLARIDAPTLRRWIKAMMQKRVQYKGRNDRRNGKRISRTTVVQVLTLLRKALDWAVEETLLQEHPAHSIKVPRGQSPTEEPWDYLRPDEQTALTSCPAVPLDWRMAIAFAIGTGIREGEQFNLKLTDVHLGEDPHIVVRYGSKRRGPKGRRIRRVPLFGLGLETAQAWLAELSRFAPRNPMGLMWPTAGGYRRIVGDLPDWPDWLRAAGIGRHVRWHDLRHTCAASLVSGWWGRPWRLEEIRDLLGHRSIQQTERYAHLGETVVKQAATETHLAHVGPRLVHEFANDAELPRKLATSSPPCMCSHSAKIPPVCPPKWTSRGPAELAEKVLRRVAVGVPIDPADLHALALAVLAEPAVRLAHRILAGDEFALDRALELAALLVDSVERDRATGGRR